MRKIYCFIIVVVMLLLNLVLLFNIVTERSLNEEYLKMLNDAGIIYNLIRANRISELKNSSTKLKDDVQIVNTFNNTVFLKDIISSGYKLIIKNSELACSVCIENELSILKKYFSKIGEENVIIIYSDSNIRKLKVFQKKYKINLPMYSVEKLGIDFENNNRLFVFVMNSDLIVRDMFIPEKTLPSLSEDYYKTIIKKYFNKNL